LRTSSCLLKRLASSGVTPPRSPVSKSRLNPLWRKLFITAVDCNVTSYMTTRSDRFPMKIGVHLPHQTHIKSIDIRFKWEYFFRARLLKAESQAYCVLAHSQQRCESLFSQISL